MLRNAFSLKMLIILSILFCSSWSQVYSPKELDAAETKKLAIAGGKIITVKDIDDVMSGFGQEMFGEKADKINILKELVRIEVFSREARALGLQDEQKLKSEITRFIDVLLAKEYIKRNVSDMVTVSEREIKEYYDTHSEEFFTPEKMRVRQIFLGIEPGASPTEIDNKRAQAEDISRLIKEGTDFSLLSLKYSEDTTLRDRQGDLGYITHEALSPEYSDVVFTLDIGEVSPVVRSEYGFSIFKSEDYLPTDLQPLDQVTEEIKQNIRHQKVDKAFWELEKKLYTKYNVEIWEDNLRNDAQPTDDDDVLSSGENDISSPPKGPEIDEGQAVDTGLPGYPKEPTGEIEKGTPGSKPSKP